MPAPPPLIVTLLRSRGSPRREPLMYGAIMACAAAGYAVLSLPTIANAAAFLLGGVGAFAKVDRLLRHGLLPGVDFPFNYGLLGLVAQHLATSSFGGSPWVPVAATVVLFVGVSFLVGVLASAVGLGRWGLLAVALLSPHLLWSMCIEPWVHGLEAVLIVLSLLALVRGRHSAAAIAAFAAALLKPGMGFALCALVLLVAFSDRGPRAAWKTVAALGVAAIGLLSALLLRFGSRSLVASIAATDARLHYAAMGFGPRQLVRGFLAPPHANIGYFFGHPVILLVAMVVVVSAAGCGQVYALFRRGSAPAPFLLVSVALTWLWILVLFGSAFAWGYYLYLPVLGCLLAIESWPGAARRSAWAAVIVLALLSYRTVVWPLLFPWSTTAPSRAFGGLWSDPALVTEWVAVGRMTGPGKAVAVTWGGEPAFFGRVQEEPFWILAPGLDNAQVTRIMQTAVASSCFVVRDIASGWVPPAIDRQLRTLPVVTSGRYFRLYRNPTCAYESAAPRELPTR